MVEIDINIVQEWRQFRADMARGDNLGRWLELKSIFKISSKDATDLYLRELVNDEHGLLLLPSPGSPLWSEWLDLPHWFYRYLTGYDKDKDPLEVLKAARRDKKKIVKRRQVGKIVMTKRKIK